MQDVQKVINSRKRYGFNTRPPCPECRTGRCESRSGQLKCLECWWDMLTPTEFDKARHIINS